MKTSVLVDVDTDREQKIIFVKPKDFVQPETREEASKVIINDIISLSEAITTLIFIADQNNYGKKDDLINGVIKTLHQIMNENKDNKNG